MSHISGHAFTNNDGSNVNQMNTNASSMYAANTMISTSSTCATTDTTTNSTIAGTGNNTMSLPLPSSTAAAATTATTPTKPTPAAHPTLPDGRLIDGKNTLQSIAVIDVVRAAATPPTASTCGDSEAGAGRMNDHSANASSFKQPPGFLFDGQPIDHKNTLQSFVGVTLPMKSPAVSEQGQPSNSIVTVPTGDISTSTTPSGIILDLEEEEDVVHAEAVPVVDADIADSQVIAPMQHRFQQRLWYCLAFIVFIVVITVGIGTFCGTGNCGNSPSSTGTSLAKQQPTMSPTTVYEKSLSIACNFLNSADLSECQNSTTFSRNSVFGVTIPTEIGLLTQTTSLELNEKELTGSIPSSIGDLTLIEKLLLNENHLTGTIPMSMGNLIQLTELQLNENNLTSSIPSTLGYLTELTSLRLATNQLNGTIPSSLGNMEQLIFLRLHLNQLEGPIPSTLGNLTQLSLLTLYSNQLTGTIPSTLGNLKQLTTMWFHLNQLSGTIPSTFGNLNQLASLSLRDNQLKGTIPSSLGELTLLTNLWLFNNTQLTGTIPPALCSLSNIEIRIDCANIVCACCHDASGNHTCPSTAPTTLPTNASETTTSSPVKAPIPTMSIPTQVPTSPPEEPQLSVACNFLNITSLSVCQATTSFDGNSVGNEIPTEIGLMTQLTALRLVDNQLNGTIPSTIGNLILLKELYLTYSKLTGTIPSTLGNLIQLTDLSLIENRLTGTIPSALGKLTQLTYLDLDRNPSLYGTIPSTLCSVPAISIFVDYANIACTCGTDRCA